MAVAASLFSLAVLAPRPAPASAAHLLAAAATASPAARSGVAAPVPEPVPPLEAPQPVRPSTAPTVRLLELLADLGLTEEQMRRIADTLDRARADTEQWLREAGEALKAQQEAARSLTQEQLEALQERLDALQDDLQARARHTARAIWQQLTPEQQQKVLQSLRGLLQELEAPPHPPGPGAPAAEV